MAFGGFGLGGLGLNYPMRDKVPESAALSLLPNQDDWLADWEKRRAAEAAKARPAIAPKKQIFDEAAYLAANPDVAAEVRPGGFSNGLEHFIKHGWTEGRQGVNFDEAKYLQMNPDVNAAVYPGGFPSGLYHFINHGWTEGRTVNQTPGRAGYTPDFSALDAERNKMMPLFENQMRQQQAYDWMQGAHQQNAIMSPEYATAGFNTITGMSNPYAGPGQIDGVSMDWAQGVYDPNTQRGTGTYNPTNYSKNTGW